MPRPHLPPTGPISVPVNPDLLDLIPGFLANRRADARALREALQAGDLEATDRLGHSLKGVGGGYGFHDITRLGAEIESASRAGDAAAVQRAVRELDDYLRRVEPVPDPEAE